MKRRVAILTEPKKFEIIEEEIQELQPHEVLIKIEAVGMCHTDMPTYFGQSAMGMDEHGHFEMVSDLQFPTAVGHEPVGVVEAVGSAVTNLKPGDYTGGFLMPAFASHIVAPAMLCVPIPNDVESLKHCLVEPLTCVTNIVQAANPKLGDSVAVVGCGFMGLLTIAGLSHSGAKNIVALDIQDDRLELAKKFGATDTINPMKGDLKKEMLGLTDNKGFDLVVEITGSLKGLKTATAIVKYADLLGYEGRGKILIPSVYGRAETWDPEIGYELMFRSPILHSTHPGYTENYMETAEDAVRAYKTGILPIQDMITHEFKLDEINEAFELMEKNDPSYLKGIIIP